MQNVAQNKNTGAENYKIICEVFGWIGITFLIPFLFNEIYYNQLRPNLDSSETSRVAQLGIAYTIAIIATIMAFLIIFYLVYSQLPFQYIRDTRRQRIEDEAWETPEIADELPKEKAFVIQLEDNLWMAKNNSEKIYGRSNTFLFVGAFMAIAGVIFFYLQFQSFYKADTPHLNLPYLLELNLQRFGSLIFIEGIAFFFLRQYSNAMEDFRYYEAIKRQRENQYTVGLSCKEETAEFVKQFVESCEFSSNPNKLSKDETTQLLEAKKVIGPDHDVLQKFVDLVKLTRK